MSISGGKFFPGGKRETTSNVSLELTTELKPFTVHFMVKTNLALHNPKFVSTSLKHHGLNPLTCSTNSRIYN
jgi:hypothetical protein